METFKYHEGGGGGGGGGGGYNINFTGSCMFTCNKSTTSSADYKAHVVICSPADGENLNSSTLANKRANTLFISSPLVAM